MKYTQLLHVAEATGNVRRSQRCMMPDKAIKRARPHLAAALVEAVPVPGCEGYSFRAWDVGLCAAFPLHVPVAEWMRDFERCIAWACSG